LYQNRADPFTGWTARPEEREDGGAAEGHVVEVEEGGRDAIAALQLIQILAVVVHVGLVVTPDPVRYDLNSKVNLAWHYIENVYIVGAA
jgi:hypothetical protein